MHVHISKGRPTVNSTKVWLTKAGGCILENNKSHIPTNELNYILDIVSLYYFKIVAKWKELYGEEKTKFYC